MEVRIDGEYKTRNGRRVQIFKIIDNQTVSVFGAIYDEVTTQWIGCHWYSDGKQIYCDSNLDLVEDDSQYIEWSEIPDAVDSITFIGDIQEFCIFVQMRTKDGMLIMAGKVDFIHELMGFKYFTDAEKLIGKTITRPKDE